MANTFSSFGKLKKYEKEQKLFELFYDLYQDMGEDSSDSLKNQWNVYSGKDEDFKKELEKFFGAKEAIYNGMDLNSVVKSITNKIIQPFMSKDHIVTVTPDSIDTHIADRIGRLLNKQFRSGRFMEEAYKVLKDGLVHGIGFMSVGWKVDTREIPKRTLIKQLVDNGDGVEVEVEVENVQYETVITERPDFKAEFIQHIYYPIVTRWSEIPYVVRKERISKREYNERYAEKTSDKLDEFERASDREKYKTDYEVEREKIPTSDMFFGSDSIDAVDILHYYFRDGSYYVGKLFCVGEDLPAKSYSNVQLIYEGSSPVPGLPIPIIPYIPDPISKRLVGESVVTIAQPTQRKLTELDNLIMRIVRNQASAPVVYNDESGLDLQTYLNRTPNQPIKLKGDINQIKELQIAQMNPAYMNIKDYAYSELQRITGQSDFAMGNIGRATPITDLIHTPNGLVENRDLKVGDEVCTPDGKTAKILELFPQGEIDVYTLKFSDGSTAEASLEHLWEVFDSKYGKPEVITTERIIEKLTKGYSLAIPTSKIEYNETPTKLNPYLMGVMLGDGSMNMPYGARLSCPDSDIEIVDRFVECGFEVTKESAPISYYIKGIRDLMPKMKCHYKYVPEEYKYNTKEVRLEVLRGLLDTDGHCCCPKQAGSTIEFTSVSKQLAEDTAFLVRTLGGYAKIVKGKSINSAKKVCGDRYRVFIRFSEGSENPFKLARKASTWKPCTRNPQRRIVSVELTHKEECQCMSIDSTNQLYICGGDKVVVTHNSARLTGVDSLIGMTMSRMAMAMAQFSQFILEVTDALVLLNRAFLPLDYAKYNVGIYAEEASERLNIPYPLNVNIVTAISGSADASIRLNALREAIQIGMTYEASQPGSVDLMALIQQFFSEAGLKDIGRYFLKSPLTQKEREMLHLIDSINAMQQSSLPGAATMQSTNTLGQLQQPQQGSVALGNDVGGIDMTGQSGTMPGLNESTGTSF